MIAYLKILLIRISNLQRHAAGNPSANLTLEYKLFQQFIDLLEKNYNTKREVAFYAAHLHVPPRRLATISRQFDRRSPKELIDNRVIIAAKRLLQFDPMPVKEVAYALSFSDQYQFSKFFRKHAAVSPVEYRSQMQNGK
jgi:AraC-like DNA-binding protein